MIIFPIGEKLSEIYKGFNVADSNINNLPSALEPLLGTDFLVVSRGGIFANYSQLKKLPLSDAVIAALGQKINYVETVDYGTTLELTGNTQFAQRTIDANTHFTVAGAPLNGARHLMRLVADGLHAPTFSAVFKELNSSIGYINTTGVVNIVEVYYDGVDYLYSIIQRKSDYAGGSIGSGGTATIASVGNASSVEGGNLTHVVTMSTATIGVMSFAFAVANVTTSGAGDYSTTYTFTNGVTLSGNTLSVPAGVTSFNVVVATVNDSTAESTETYTLTIGGQVGIGTINDNDTSTPTVASVSNASATEGGTLVHTVTLTSTTIASTPLTFALNDVGTSGTSDISASYTFSNGVTLSGGTLSVPTGFSSFTVTVSTVNDSTAESNETYSLVIGGVTGTGTITDNDASGGTISTPTVSKTGVFTTVSFTTSNALRAGVEFGSTTSYGTAVVEDFGTTATTHSIVLEANANPLFSPHGLTVGQTYNLRAVAGIGGTVISPNITFVA